MRHETNPPFIRGTEENPEAGATGRQFRSVLHGEVHHVRGLPDGLHIEPSIPENLADPQHKDNLILFQNNNDVEFDASMKRCVAILEESLED